MSNSNFTIQRVQGAPVSSAELLEDLASIARNQGWSTVGLRQYEKLGKYSYTTFSRRFGSWNEALKLAGLSTSNEINLSDEALFENILVLWQYFGRQPRRSELAHPPSVISQSPYNRRFGSWLAALEAFVNFANSAGTEMPVDKGAETRRTGRDPSLRLRWQVLQRDRFICCGCGASPALSFGVELHVDHVVAWSKGGETVLDNLQTLCSACNYGKSNS
ncbi:MAG: homing endonuclease associated repeat-containing protein [Acidovorax sp.]|uniref:homing endonuclease associated repeat-containing protein n=1 Tax=Acidovorax sp. TaxID=1872122 RepID=UPI00391B4F03